MRPESEPSDEEVVRRAQRGDKSAERELFDRHADAMRARVRRRLPPSLRAKLSESDVVQDAYLAAYRRLAEFEDRGENAFKCWLTRIVDNRVVDEVRNHVGAAKRDLRREVRLPTGAEPASRRTKQRSPASEVVAAEEEAAVGAAMSELPSHYAAVLRWIHEDGLTAAQAGARMDRSAEAVRKLYARALARLADALERRERRRS